MPPPSQVLSKKRPHSEKMKIEKSTYPQGELIHIPIEFRSMALTIMPHRPKLVWCDIGLPNWGPTTNLFHYDKFSFFDFELRIITIIGFFFGFAQQF